MHVPVMSVSVRHDGTRQLRDSNAEMAEQFACEREMTERSGRRAALDVASVLKHKEFDSFSMFGNPKRFG